MSNNKVISFGCDSDYTEDVLALKQVLMWYCRSTPAQHWHNSLKETRESHLLDHPVARESTEAEVLLSTMGFPDNQEPKSRLCMQNDIIVDDAGPKVFFKRFEN